MTGYAELVEAVDINLITALLVRMTGCVKLVENPAIQPNTVMLILSPPVKTANQNPILIPTTNLVIRKTKIIINPNHQICRIQKTDLHSTNKYMM
ncbi:Hypothetical predicted protein [Mytilus galloprovincialis]|uniref:Uncharacterized protein n=1 Tax=Mytilus galloprovincialis TaxID=29158 RepID=A0A8B6HKS4_MYTGA|nr:Hypothetical predicted protein [Mytilus galloprovincialis]